MEEFRYGTSLAQIAGRFKTHIKDNSYNVADRRSPSGSGAGHLVKRSIDLLLQRARGVFLKAIPAKFFSEHKTKLIRTGVIELVQNHVYCYGF